MAGKQDIVSLLRSFSVRKKSHSLPMTELVRYTERYVEQKASKEPGLRDLASDTQLKLVTFLEELSKDGTCELNYDEGKIKTVFFPEFYLAVVRKRYSELDQDADMPYPTENSLGITIPQDQISAVDVKAEFVSMLEEKRFEKPQLIRLVFPEGINSIIAPSELVDTGLMKLALQRIRQYLSIQKNAFYMVSKLRSVFKTKEQVVRDMINNVLTQRQQATESLVNPTEFSFSFWTHLANAIIKELRDKSNKPEREHTFCQAAYLIGFYAVQHKTERRKEKDTQAAYKVLDRKLHSEPYVFTVSEIAAFTDEQGVPLTKRYTRNELHAFIEKKTRPQEDELPEIIRLKSADTKEYFVCKEVVLPLALKKISDASTIQTRHYVDTFAEAMQKSKKLPEMKSDQAFLSDVEKRVKNENQLLNSMLSFDLLFLLLQEIKPKAEVGAEINRLLDTQHQTLIQMDELLDLSRKELINQAKMRLPFWQTVPVLNRLFGLLGRMASGKQTSRPSKQARQSSTSSNSKRSDKSRSSGAGSAPAGSSTKVLGGDAPETPSGGSKPTKNPAVVLQAAMSKLKVEFVGTASLQESMTTLIDKWNPLFDAEAKSNLVEDVNSLIRDFLRKLKRSFLVKPPDAARIKNMAESLSENKAFDKVKRKQDLMRYMELYMIKVLGGK